MGGEGVRNRRRGFQFERDVVNEAKSLGLEAERMWGSNGKAKGLPTEVDLIINGMHFQCKRKKRFAKDLQPTESVHGQIIKQDRQEPLIVLRLSDYLSVLANDCKKD